MLSTDLSKSQVVAHQTSATDMELQDFICSYDDLDFSDLFRDQENVAYRISSYSSAITNTTITKTAFTEAFSISEALPLRLEVKFIPEPSFLEVEGNFGCKSQLSDQSRSTLLSKCNLVSSFGLSVPGAFNKDVFEKKHTLEEFEETLRLIEQSIALDLRAKACDLTADLLESLLSDSRFLVIDSILGMVNKSFFDLAVRLTALRQTFRYSNELSNWNELFSLSVKLSDTLGKNSKVLFFGLDKDLNVSKKANRFIDRT